VRKLGAALRTGQPQLSDVRAFESAVGAPRPANGSTNETRLGAALRYAGAVDALRQACSDGISARVPRQASRVLELLYCEPCGEVFLGGYRGSSDNPNQWRLTPDFPDLEQVPDRAGAERDYDNYAVFWPATGRTPASPQWQEDYLRREWRPARLNRASGILTSGIGGDGYLCHVPAMHSRPRAGARRPHTPGAFPSRCPRCDADWAGRSVGSPIRGQRTGFQKIAQVLADALLREIAPPGQDANRKLVVFSDSRQDAAKLSAGMRQAHHLDAVRQAVAETLAIAGQGADAFFRQAQGQALGPAQLAAANAFFQSVPQDARILSMGAGAAANAPCPSRPGRTNAQAAAEIVADAAAGPYLLGDLFRDAERALLNAGINPGGYGKDALWTDPDNQRSSWRDLYDWSGASPVERYTGLRPEQCERGQAGSIGENGVDSRKTQGEMVPHRAAWDSKRNRSHHS
jgi:DEAD/DEAH box helicase domain-containing protein